MEISEVKSQEEADRVSQSIQEEIDRLTKSFEQAQRKIVKVKFTNYDAIGYLHR
jgi:hypothetical protein